MMILPDCLAPGVKLNGEVDDPEIVRGVDTIDECRDVCKGSASCNFFHHIASRCYLYTGIGSVSACGLCTIGVGVDCPVV